jgi:hypothetical protein
MLRRGLGTRCLAIAGTLQPDCALVGIVLDSANGFRKLDAGPPADDTAAAAAFRAFWGSKAELRRFRGFFFALLLFANVFWNLTRFFC